MKVVIEPFSVVMDLVGCFFSFFLFLIPICFDWKCPCSELLFL